MAYDKLHNGISEALKANGFNIIRDPLCVKHGSFKFFVDLEAERNGEKFAIEIKSFNNSFLAEFYKIIGQVIVYGRVLKLRKMPHRLFLALEHTAWNGYFQETVPRLIMKRYHFNIISVDIERKHLEMISF